ncbi:hypothetical protein [Paenibacillus contaminans]|uniref:hypothetical protein n=1 Tax=Paenibacillus contaminans TaxID=450362 RepID=UPI001863D84B|nr:hypothetical protein [Paenibacillus contaminans]
MKLLVCTECLSVFSLDIQIKRCQCGAVIGRYLDDVTAIYSGDDAIPIGFNNTSLFKAIKDQPTDGLGLKFKAFVIPKECSTFHKQTLVNESTQVTYNQLVYTLKQKISEIEGILENSTNDEFLRGKLSGLKNAVSLISILCNSDRSNPLINIEIDTTLHRP